MSGEMKKVAFKKGSEYNYLYMNGSLELSRTVMYYESAYAGFAIKKGDLENMDLPQDPIMLLSYVNTQLRDNYASLDDFCAAMDISRKKLEEALAAVDYEYDAGRNAFI